MTTPQSAENKSAYFVNFIASLSVLGISVYLLLHYALDVGHPVYTLSANIGLTSADARPSIKDTKHSRSNWFNCLC